MDGPTLAEILVSGPIPLRGVAAMSYHLASTIAAVHHADIIHRDIKPSNIICSPRGPVLIDFGIAMAVEDQHLTRTGLVSGTAGYTAPELLQGGHATKESDWWAWCGDAPVVRDRTPALRQGRRDRDHAARHRG